MALLALLGAALLSVAEASLSVSNTLGSNMCARPHPPPLPTVHELRRGAGRGRVLQRGRPAPIWGWQTAGAKVSVSFRGETHSATAGADGLWKVELPAQPASLAPQVIAISSGGEQTSLDNVLFGDVILCSGQSNMCDIDARCPPPAIPLTLTRLRTGSLCCRAPSTPLRRSRRRTPTHTSGWSTARSRTSTACRCCRRPTPASRTRSSSTRA